MLNRSLKKIGLRFHWSRKGGRVGKPVSNQRNEEKTQCRYLLTGLHPEIRTLQTVLELTDGFANVVARPALLEELEEVVCYFLRIEAGAGARC